MKYISSLPINDETIIEIDNRLTENIINNDIRFTGYIIKKSNKKIYGRIYSQTKQNILYQGLFVDDQIHGDNVKIYNNEEYMMCYEGKIDRGNKVKGTG